MSRPINKLKSHIFFTCKYFLVPDFTGKKNFAPENSGGGLAPPPPPPCSLPFPYGPDIKTQFLMI